jgi:hypothetical protein
MSDKFIVKWVDSGHEPQCKPDPNYPKGIDLDFSRDDEPACTLPLPYPAKRCGHYTIRCKECGLSVMVTTAGRPDDPKSLRMPCSKIKSAA